MTDAISKDEYDDEVSKQATILAENSRQDVATYHTTDGEGGYEDYPGAVFENVSDVLYGHNWFARSYYGGSLYGSIIEHSEADPSLYTDWEIATDANSPEKVLERLAYVVFEADVIRAALEIPADD